MRLFGLDIRRASRAVPARTKSLPFVTDIEAFNPNSNVWTRIFESFAGAWQRNIEISAESVLAYAAVYACATLIASDVGKMRWKLEEESAAAKGIWEETTNSAYSPVLRKPNHFQTHIQMKEHWMLSKLIHGNTYALKARDNRGGAKGGNVVALYVLDPRRVRVLVTPRGDVYYQLAADNLSGIGDVTVPASEIMHDRMATLYHPLCGVSPITACGLAALQGLTIQKNQTKLFSRGLQPPGILTVTTPGTLDEEEALKLQARWDQHFAGEDNAGKIAVLGTDMKYQSLTINGRDAQLIDQLKWTATEVCTAFKVPPHKIGVGTPPTYNNVEALDAQYYSQCLQTHIENLEALMDEGLDLADNLGTALDLLALMRMDTPTRVKAAADAINGGGMTVNESRATFHGLGPVPGGDAVLSQQQNFSVEALAKRDARPDPFASASASLAPRSAAEEDEADDVEDADKAVGDLLRKELQMVAA